MNILFTINKKDEEQNSIKENVENKVLILSCGTGGGHNSAALAIQENLIEKGIRADFIEYLDIISPKIKNQINHLYIKSTYGNGKVFKAVYHLGELYQKLDIKSPVYQLNKMNRKKLYKYIKEHGYKYIVTTHLFAAQALTAIKKEYPIHFMQIATDYVCIPFWEETNPDLFVIPSPLLKEGFVKKGFKEEILLPTGIPVATSFFDTKEIPELKDKDVILLTSGSMGFGQIKDIVVNLLAQINNAYLVVICGSNEKLKEELEKIDNVNLIVKGFVNNMNDYMAASTVVISKPGGLTTTEIAAMNKPLVHMMPIPGVEDYNANFFANNKMSIRANNINEIVDATKKLLSDKMLREELMINQRKLINKYSAKSLVEYVLKYMNDEEVL